MASDCRAYIPHGAYWSTPFARWQGAFQHLHSLEFAAHVAKREMARRNLPIDVFDFGVLGATVPQPPGINVLPSPIRANRAILDRIVDLAERGAVKPRIGVVLPLAEGVGGYELMRAARTRGKIVLEMPR